MRNLGRIAQIAEHHAPFEILLVFVALVECFDIGRRGDVARRDGIDPNLGRPICGQTPR